MKNFHGGVRKLNPHIDTFLADAKTYLTIPLVKELFSDMLTPVQLFDSLKEEAVYMLESHDQQSEWSRYSFIGLDPYMTIEGYHDGAQVFDENKTVIKHEKSLKEAFSYIQKYLKVKKANVQVPFTGGAVGSVNYDAIATFEKVNLTKQLNKSVPLYEFLFCETMIALDHKQNRLFIIHYVRLRGNEQDEVLKDLYQEGLNRINIIIDKISSSTSSQLHFSVFSPQDIKTHLFKSNYKKTKFLQDVETIKNYIKSGDVFQTVLSQRFEREVTVSGFNLYRVLRQLNPSPYMFYLKTKRMELIGSSPERLVQVLGDHVEIHPIAGTRKRGKTEEEDQLLEQELLSDEKEKAEHYMLVDLARNDVGRIAEYGSIQLPTLLGIERFSHVMHIISKVTGRLRKDQDPFDAFIAAFPAGTVSGAPKIRAMEIIDELEPTKRNAYAGGVVYIDFEGNIDSCITIRTIQLKDNRVMIQAGAGIVADSIPENEFEETINKARALFQTVEVAEQLFGTVRESDGGVSHV